MKLYELPINKKIKIYIKLPDGSTYLTYCKMDGFYGVLLKEKGGLMYLTAGTPLTPHKDGYRIGSIAIKKIYHPKEHAQKNKVTTRKGTRTAEVGAQETIT